MNVEEVEVVVVGNAVAVDTVAALELPWSFPSVKLALLGEDAEAEGT